MASVIMEMGDGCTPEILTIGSEGIGEAVHLLGPGRVPSRAFMKISGTGLQMSFSMLERLFRVTGDARNAAATAERISGLKSLPPDVVRAGNDAFNFVTSSVNVPLLAW